jgi:hypothetical protein
MRSDFLVVGMRTEAVVGRTDFERIEIELTEVGVERAEAARNEVGVDLLD